MSEQPTGDETPKNFEEAFEDDFVSKEEHSKALKKSHDQELRAKKAEAEKAELAARIKELEGKNTTPEEKKPEEPAAPAQPSVDMQMLEDVVMAQGGFSDPAEKEIIRNAAKELNIPIQEAMTKKYVLAEISETRASVEAEKATEFKGSGGGDTPTQDELIVREFEKSGDIPNLESSNPNEIVRNREATLKIYDALKKKEGL